jgi:hypothetical protein
MSPPRVTASPMEGNHPRDDRSVDVPSLSGPLCRGDGEVSGHWISF